MRKKIYGRSTIGIGCAVLILCGSAAPAQATQAEFQMIKELERQEREVSDEALIERPQYRYTAGTERDPFDGLITRDEEQGTVKISDSVEVPPPAMTVQGVIWGGAFPLAIVNDQLVKEGDTIGSEVEIVHIEAYGVIFKFHDKEYTLSAPAVQVRSE